MQTDYYSPHQCDPEALQQQRQRLAREPAPLTFHSAPEDMVVGITFLLRLRGPRAGWKKVVTTISHRALFALADADRRRPTYTYSKGDGDGDGSGEGEQKQEGEGEGEEGEGKVTEEDSEEGVMGEVVDIVPWEEWGPRAARVISPPTFHWITAHAGQRWLSLEDDKLVIRDFSAARVLRATRATTTTTTSASSLDYHLRYHVGGDGSGTAPVLAPAQTRIRGHVHSQSQAPLQALGGSMATTTCFGEDVVSELPFLESRVDARGRGRVGDMVLTDGERLVSFVRMPMVSSLSFPPTHTPEEGWPRKEFRGGIDEWKWKQSFSDSFVLSGFAFFFFWQGQPPIFEIYVLEDGDDEQELEVQEEVQEEEVPEEVNSSSSANGSLSPSTGSPNAPAATTDDLNLSRMVKRKRLGDGSGVAID